MWQTIQYKNLSELFKGFGSVSLYSFHHHVSSLSVGLMRNSSNLEFAFGAQYSPASHLTYVFSSIFTTMCTKVVILKFAVFLEFQQNTYLSLTFISFMDKKLYILPIFALLLIPSFAYGDFLAYEPWQWKTNPEICINFDNQTSHYKYGVIKAIDEWKVDLNNATTVGKFDYNVYENSTEHNHTHDCNVVFNLDFPLAGFPQLPIDAYGYTQCVDTMCTVFVFDTTPSNYLIETVKHEMGHVLGLGHRLPYTKCDLIAVVESNDIMIPQAGPFRWITLDDLKALVEDYGLSFNGTHYNPPNQYSIMRPMECV